MSASELEVSEYSMLIKEGYLNKQSSSSYFSSWKTKWIVLKGFCLLIFNTKPKRGSSDVEEIYDLTIYDCLSRLTASSKNDTYEFELLSSSNKNTKQFPAAKFKASSNQEMFEWINYIQKQINKISINDTIINDNNHNEYDDSMLPSISQLIDDGFTTNETSLAIKISVNDNSSSDEDDDEGNAALLNASFDPRSMFDMFESSEMDDIYQTDNGQTKGKDKDKKLKTALLSAINETMDDSKEETTKFDYDIIKDMNFKKISLSIQDILDIKEDKDNDSTITKTKGNEDKDKDKVNKITDNGVFELKSMNNTKGNDKKDDTEISELCLLALKQLELLRNEENENLIEIKKMNLIETMNKIKNGDPVIYENMIKDKEWMDVMNNSLIIS